MSALYVLLLSLLGSASAFAPGAAPLRAPAARSLTAQPRMIIGIEQQLAIADKVGMDLPTMMLAAETVRKSIKSEADEFLDEAMSAFPLIVRRAPTHHAGGTGCAACLVHG